MKNAVTSTRPMRDDSVNRHFGVGKWPAVEQAASPSESDVDPARALAFREDQIQILEQQKYEIAQRLRGLETGRWSRSNDHGQL